jgi:NADPH2:quinone reductase
MKAWRTQYYGNPLEVLKLEDVELPEPNPGELRVKVQAIPLNLNDLERVMGGNMMVEPELPYIAGMEVMGTVEACGEGVESWAGKRVVATTAGAHGGFAEYACCPVVSAFEVPDAIPLPDAAALYFPFHLAWLGLYDRADLQAGETVLIHAAAGGSGSAAIQLAKAVGARVIATAGSEDKLKLCLELGADIAINYSEGDFAAEVLAATDNNGVDVVFDNVGEAVMEQSMNCLAYNGRYLMMGFASNKAVADEKFLVPRRITMGNFKLCGVLLAYADAPTSDFLKQGMGWSFASDTLGQKIQDDINARYLAGELKTVVGQTHDFDNLPQAVKDLADRKTTGRSIILL